MIGFILTNVMLVAQDQEEKRRNWIVPSFINTQYAGGIGNYIIGAGYFLNKSQSLRLIIQYGFTPKYKTNNEQILS